MSLFEKFFDIERSGRRHFYGDLSFWALILTNLIVIVLALIEGWPPGVIMWIYWGQSVAIGISWFFKILTLREFSTEYLSDDDKPVQPTLIIKVLTAFFFLFHYNFLHLFYAHFLSSKFGFAPISQAFTAIGIFAIYQSFSFFYNRKWQAEHKPNIGIMMIFPYARIIPMHVTIILTIGYEQNQALLLLALFLFLKLLADVYMHYIESNSFTYSKKDAAQLQNP